MPARLREIHTIPVYENFSALESYFLIVNSDGEGVPDSISKNVSYWANVGVFENSLGEVATMVLST